MFIFVLSDESDLKDIFRDFNEGDDIFSLINEELKDDGEYRQNLY